MEAQKGDRASFDWRGLGCSRGKHLRNVNKKERRNYIYNVIYLLVYDILRDYGRSIMKEREYQVVG